MTTPIRKPYEWLFREMLWERAGRRCAICRKAMLLADVTVDHIVALSAGGRDHWTNLQEAHQRCNSRKGSRVWPRPVSGLPTPVIQFPKRCASCNAPLLGRAVRDRRTCSDACRQKAYRRRRASS